MKPRLSVWQIVNMNLGFFGIQYAFGLQKSNMSPIYRALGADESTLPYLWLSAPIAGLAVPPIIGALSDHSRSRWGRRTPYLFAGAVLTAVALFFMPFSATIGVAAGLLCLLAAAGNMTMQPYRAFVSDRLQDAQQSLGFLIQSAFTGLGQTLAYLTPSLLVVLGLSRHAVTARNIPRVTMLAFVVGAFFSVASILWTLFTTREPPAAAEAPTAAPGRPADRTGTLAEILAAVREMPPTMRQLILVQFLQWYAMYCFWQYIVLALARTLFATADAGSAGFREAGLINGQIGGFYNFVAFGAALAILPLTRKFGPQLVHSTSMVLAGAGLIWLPGIHDRLLLFVPMIGLGIAWASMMGTPYVMLTGCIPPHRAGVYMGIVNLFIVLPMIVQIFSLPLIYPTWLGGDPGNVIRLSGVLLLATAVAVLFVRTAKTPAPTAGENA
jgi:maltose/moltooligosaccharide transporter